MSEIKLRELKRKWILFYSVILFFLLMVITLLTMAYMIDRESSYLYFLMMFLLIGGYTLMNFTKVLRIRIPKFRLIKVLKCEKCGYIKTASPLRGDYVFKVEDKCPRCNAPMVIIRIYRESLTK